jgi:hypothetical protein
MNVKCFRAVVALALCGAACGRVSLDQPDDAGRPTGAVVDAAIGTDAPPDGETPTPLPPFATIIRVTNVGATDFMLDGEAVTTCPYGFGIQGGAPVDQATPLEAPDSSCGCDTCGSTIDGHPRCTSTDFLCQDPPHVLPPGAHFDFPWPGTVQIWLSPPPAESHCAIRCTAVVPVPAGRYTFTLAYWPAGYTVEAALPAPSGIIEIPVTPP